MDIKRFAFPTILALLIAAIALIFMAVSGGFTAFNVLVIAFMAIVVFIAGISIQGMSVKDTVIIGVIAAMIIVGTLIKIPFGTALVHLGSAVLFTFALLVGGKRAGLAGGIGSALFDIIGGFSVYTPWSFAIKLMVGLCIGSIALHGEWSIKKNILALICGTLVSALGYFIAWWAVLGTMEAAVANLGATFLTSGVGCLVAIPLAPILRAAGIKPSKK